MPNKVRLLLLASLVMLFGLAQGQNDQRVEIYNLRNHIHPTFTRIVVDIGKLREYYYSQLASPDRIYVDIYQAKLNPILHGKTEPLDNYYLKTVRIAQKNQTTVRVVADINSESRRLGGIK